MSMEHVIHDATNRAPWPTGMKYADANDIPTSDELARLTEIERDALMLFTTSEFKCRVIEGMILAAQRGCRTQFSINLEAPYLPPDDNEYVSVSVMTDALDDVRRELEEKGHHISVVHNSSFNHNWVWKAGEVNFFATLVITPEKLDC